MSATRKDYRAAAAAFAGALASYPESAEGISRAARDLATHFKSDNPRFRFDIFFEACGLDSFGDVKPAAKPQEASA